MEATILKARENLDSVGGKVECVALHVPAGIGEPFFDSLESHLSSLMFSIPAVKSVSFGDGEMIDQMLGSEANDCYYYDENGNQSVGEKKIEGKWYYFDKEGVMQTGFQTIPTKNGGTKKYVMEQMELFFTVSRSR